MSIKTKLQDAFFIVLLWILALALLYLVLFKTGLLTH